jgi:hypothetical protein
MEVVEMNRNWIPRNLNEADFVSLGFGLKIKMLDLPILACGGLISYLCNAGSGNTVVIVLSSAVIMTSSFLLTRLKKEGQNALEVVKNAALYGGRKYYYKKRSVNNDKGNTNKLHKYIIQKFQSTTNDNRELRQNAQVNRHNSANPQQKSNRKG